MSDLIEDQISDAMEQGAFDNLPGAGKPLRLEQDRLVPEEYRLAYRIMRDNDVQPEWIALQREIAQRVDEARTALREAAHLYYSVMREFENRGGLQSVMKRLEARDNRDFAIACFRDEVRVINRKIAIFNLKVPASHLTRDLLELERELTAAFPL